MHPPSTPEAALAAATGQTLSFVRPRETGGADTLRASVVRSDPPQYRLSDGRFLLSPPGEPLFPPELVRTAPEAALTLEAARARPRTELANVVDGAAQWQAVYQVVLQGVRCQVSGAATITSASLRADSAEIQLVAGSINRARTAPRPQFLIRGYNKIAGAEEAPAAASEETVGETHVYQLPGRQSLEPGMSLSVALFPQATASYTQEFVVPGVLPWRGWMGQNPEPNRVPVQVWYTIKRAAKTPFGDRPLPAGTVQLYQADSSGRVQLIGEASNDHTAAGRDLRVQSGDAFDITAERVQTDWNQEQLPPLRRGMPNR